MHSNNPNNPNNPIYYYSKQWKWNRDNSKYNHNYNRNTIYINFFDPPKIDIHNSYDIKFFDESQPWYEFSNFYEGANFIVNKISYKTPEHYYQWQKFNDPIVQNRIVQAPTARMATSIANSNKHLIINNFDKKNAMLNSLRQKFSQHKVLGDMLKSTGDRQLIEHNMYDDYWSDGGDGTGLNTFGILLMQVRTELNNGTLKYI